MPKKTWTLNLADGPHTIVLDHGSITGKRAIFVDDKPLELPPDERRKTVDTGSRHTFTLAGQPMAVVIRTNGVTFSYDLEVDGQSQASGKSVDSLEGKEWQTRENRKQTILVNLVFGVILVIYVLLNQHRDGLLYNVLYWMAPVPLVTAAYYALVNEDPRDRSNLRRPRAWMFVILCLILGFFSQAVLG